MKIIKEQDDLKIYYDGKKYTVYYRNRVLLTYSKGYPTLINDDLIIVDDDIINIYRNIRQGLQSASIISKQGIVLAKPILYNNIIIVVFKNLIVQFDTNLNIIKKTECWIDGTISDEKIVDNKYFAFVINKDNILKDIFYDIENNCILEKGEKHDKILSRS